jgi:hypothetical protein
MKKLILSLFGVALIATAVYAASTQMKNTGAGLQIATTAAQKLGFFGATPIVQPATNLQLAVTVGAGDATTVSNVVVLVNQLRLDLVNLGLIKGTNN